MAKQTIIRPLGGMNMVSELTKDSQERQGKTGQTGQRRERSAQGRAEQGSAGQGGHTGQTGQTDSLSVCLSRVSQRCSNDETNLGRHHQIAALDL